MKVRKTGKGIEIKPSHFTHKFNYNGKSVPIGNFDPSTYDQSIVSMISKDCFITNITKFQQEIFDQLEDSKEFSKEELIIIAKLSSNEFISCLTLNK